MHTIFAIIPFIFQPAKAQAGSEDGKTLEVSTKYQSNFISLQWMGGSDYFCPDMYAEKGGFKKIYKQKE